MPDTRVGFRAPDGRYWEATDVPSLAVVVSYPAGTVQMTGANLRPSHLHTWNNGVWEEPDPEAVKDEARTGMRLTFAQLVSGVRSRGWITQLEFDQWIAGTPPAIALALIAQLPTEAERNIAKARVISPSVVIRLDPLVIAMATAAGQDADGIDAFFTEFSQI